MRIERMTVGVFQVNTWLITDESSGLSALVDTGEGEDVRAQLQAMEGLQLAHILLTHAHLDHAGALADIQEAFPGATTWLPEDEKPLFHTLPMQGTMFGMPHLDRPCGRIDQFVHGGDTVQMGELTFTFVPTPGHTPGQGCWWVGDDLFVGDTLFAGSIGRTDFPMFNPATAVESLRRLMELPGHLRVHSGHGPSTTLDKELRTNPFLGYLRREKGIDGPKGLSWAPGT